MTNHILDEKSTLGEMLKALLGYNGNPSLIEVMTELNTVLENPPFLSPEGGLSILFPFESVNISSAIYRRDFGFGVY